MLLIRAVFDNYLVAVTFIFLKVDQRFHRDMIVFLAIFFFLKLIAISIRDTFSCISWIEIPEARFLAVIVYDREKG